MKKQAFSLMEMMVVLLIISIIMAATAPLVAKKMKADRAAGGSSWVYTSNNGNIAYNMGGRNLTAIIGASTYNPNGGPNYPRLVLAGNADEIPAIAFADESGVYAGKISVGDNKSININDKIKYEGTSGGSGAITLGEQSDTVKIPGALQLDGLTSTSGTKYLAHVNEAAKERTDINGDLFVSGNIYVKGGAYISDYSAFGRLMTYVDYTRRQEPKSFFETDGLNDEDDDKTQNTDAKSYSQMLYNKYTEIVSDKRLKNIGEKYISGLEDLKKLDIYNFTFKHDKTKAPHVGVMAQDLEKVFPNSVSTDQTGYLRIRWDEMFYAVINAVKELDAKVADIVARIANHDSEITELKSKITELEAQNAEYKKQNAEFEKRLLKLEKRQK